MIYYRHEFMKLMNVIQNDGLDSPLTRVYTLLATHFMT